MLRVVVLAMVVLCMSNPLVAEEPSAEQVTSIEGITEYRYENGFRVLLFPDNSKPTVTVNLTIFVGSRHEGYGEAGMAHLLEHMVFKGTPDHPNVPKVLTERGARFNGTTWVDRTNYYETLPASPENLEFAIRLEADRMVNSYIKKEDLVSEMTVVRNEFERGENSPSSVLGQRMMSAAFQWHNYGKSTIGNRADIERVPIDNLKRFYKKYYQPDNAMLVVAGDFDPELALSLASKYFGTLPKPERELDKTYTEEPPQDGEKIVTLRRVGEVPLVGVLYHIPAGAHPEYPAVDVLEGILTSNPSGRLYKALVETKKAASVSGSAYAWHDPGALRIMAEVADENEPDLVLGTMLDTLEKVKEDGVTQEEVDRIKQKLLKFRELAASKSDRIAVELSEWAAMGDWRLYFVYRDRLEKVTPEDVEKVAKKYLTRSNRTVGMYIPTEKPEKTSVPETPNLVEMIGDYKGRELVSQGEAFDVSPENIQQRTKVMKLKSGTEVALLPKKTRGNSVNLRLTLRYGNAENLKELIKASEFLPNMMLRGTLKYTRQELQDALDKQRASLAASGSPGTATFSLETKRDNLPAVLDLLKQVLREPTFPAEELGIIQRAQVAGWEKQLFDPQALATTAVRRHISPWPKGDPRYVATIKEELEWTKQVTTDQLKALHSEYLTPEHAQLAIVGDFDPDEIVPLCEEMLADWKAKQPYERLTNKPAHKPGGSEEINTPDKKNAVYFSAMSFAMNDTDPDYPEMILGDFLFGGGSLSSRLGNRVRQQEGLSYGVGSGFNANSVDERAAFYIYAISNPDNVPKLKTVINEELTKLLKDGPTAEELADAKEGYLQKQTVSRSSDSSIARILSENLYIGRTMDYYTKLEAAIPTITTEEVHKALKDHINPEQLFTVVAGDFEMMAEGDKTPQK